MRIAAIALALCLLTGCASFLERDYSSVEPHSSKFWESEAADTLRAENYQDVVNDLLILIGQHTETATLRLYELGDDLQVAELLDQAISEVQQETPMGAYAVEYITAAKSAQRGHYEVSVNIGYRRSAEQIQAVVSATSAEALYSLLASAIQEGREELAVRINYWGENSPASVADAMSRLRSEYGLEEAPWAVNFYPSSGEVGLVEFLLHPTEEELSRASLTAGPLPGSAFSEESF